MKKLLIIIFLLTNLCANAQNSESATLKELNQNLTTAYQNRKYSDALEFAQKALELSRRINGEYSDDTLAAYKNLGVIYRELKKYKNSAENLQRATEIYQKKPDADTKTLLEYYNWVGLSQYLGGMENEAEATYLRAIEIAENTFGKESKESIQPMLETAIFYSKANKYEKSQDFYLKITALIIKYFGKDSSEMETVDIYSSYYSGGTGVWTNDKRYKEYKKKFAELLGYESGNAISLPIPVYPAEAIKQGKQGRTVVKIRIDEQGKVTDAKAVYGEMFFASVAEEAAVKSRFKPAISNGKPISSTAYITYKFVK